MYTNTGTAQGTSTSARARVLEHEPRHVQLWESDRWELRDADLLLPHDIECIPDFTPRGVQWVELVPAVRSEGLELVIEANVPIPRPGDRLRVAGTLWGVVEWSSDPEECRLGNDSGGTTYAARLPGVEDELMPELLTYEGDAAIFVLEGELAQSPGQQGHDMEPITVDALTIFTRGPFVVLRLKVRAEVMEWRVMAHSFELLDFRFEPDPVQLRVRLRSSMLFFLGGRTNDTQALRWNWSDGESYGPQFANEPEFECTQMNREDVFAPASHTGRLHVLRDAYAGSAAGVESPGLMESSALAARPSKRDLQPRRLGPNDAPSRDDTLLMCALYRAKALEALRVVIAGAQLRPRPFTGGDDSECAV